MAELPTALLVVSDREPLAWLLREQRFAVPGLRRFTAPGRGTRLLVYTTRGCYRNPGRDRGVVMGVARVTSAPAVLDVPVRFGDRDFEVGFDVEFDGVAPPHEGVDLGALAGTLDALPDAPTWSIRMRRTVIPLSDRDAARLVGLLAPMLRPRVDVLPAYLDACKVTLDDGGGA